MMGLLRVRSERVARPAQPNPRPERKGPRGKAVSQASGRVLRRHYSLCPKKQAAEGQGLFSLGGVGGVFDWGVGVEGVGFTAPTRVEECSQGCDLPGWPSLVL